MAQTLKIIKDNSFCLKNGLISSDYHSIQTSSISNMVIGPFPKQPISSIVVIALIILAAVCYYFFRYITLMFLIGSGSLVVLVAYTSYYFIQKQNTGIIFSLNSGEKFGIVSTNMALVQKFVKAIQETIENPKENHPSYKVYIGSGSINDGYMTSTFE